MDISRHVSVTISDDPVVRRGRKRAEIAKKYEAVKQPHIFRRKGESSVGGADNRTCLTANADRGRRDTEVSRRVSVHCTRRRSRRAGQSSVAHKKATDEEIRCYGADNRT